MDGRGSPRITDSPERQGPLIAHTPFYPSANAQPLDDHLRGVADRCESFVAVFADPAWGRLAGLWHDFGKAAPDWQEFIRSAMDHAEQNPGERLRVGPPHAPLGAVHAVAVLPRGWARDALAFAIAGHHGGLVDLENWRQTIHNADHVRRYQNAVAALSAGNADLVQACVLPPPPHILASRSQRSVELFIRFLFSALVDADSLDTEAFAAGTGDSNSVESLSARAFKWPTLADYDEALTAFMIRKQTSASVTAVNRLRRRVFEDCVTASPQPRGAFSLTVPTGGGKTLASLSFALKHAVANGQRRIVIALPFTTIIDQTADVLRGAFDGLAAEILIEHHSAVDPERETRVTRMASENWDSPLVVTTQVQLFETLFANRRSKCRKLHNLANSIIILDEVQSLPHGVLKPILDVLQELVSNYKSTLVLTTATQPSLHTRPLGGSTFLGLTPQPTEIVSDALREDLWNGLRRVDVKWTSRIQAPISEDPGEFWLALANEISTHDRVLAIVHLKNDAQALHRALKSLRPGTLHLSAAMCPAHRRQQLGEVRRRLVARETCHLVSTQVIEAGVDVDFPVVYRAMAGLESLAQSAGRCNREGLLDARGSFHVFTPPTQPPQQLRLHRDIAESMLLADPALDLFSPMTFNRYFDWVYASRELDVRDVQPLREGLRFEATATAFQMIDAGTESVFVHWNDVARALIAELRRRGPSRTLLRRLQQYTVTVYPQQKAALERSSAIEIVNGYLVLGDFVPTIFYSDDVGLVTEADSSLLCIA